MSLPKITYCPGTLAAGHDTYSTTCLRRMFNGRKVSPVLPYDAPSDGIVGEAFMENSKRISISGVQLKFSAALKKNELRLTQEGEQGTYILKPLPNLGKNSDQMPANEHLTMQIARQVFDIETAQNALVFFQNGEPAYLTKRFDVQDDGGKRAQEDFASLGGRTPQTHGTHYKYDGNYLQLFQLMKKYLPAYRLEAPKLLKLLIFNYLFSNGDAHFKNFSLLETPLGDYRLSPAYDLLNTRMHIEDSDFALENGLLPKSLSPGKVLHQFSVLAEKAEIGKKQLNVIFDSMLSEPQKIVELVEASFLNDRAKRNYLQTYRTRLNKLNRK